MQADIEFRVCNGLRLCVSVKGAGQPVLFIGGTGWDLRSRKTPLASPLVDSFQVALFDQRGMGRSDKPDGPYSMADYAEDAAALVSALGWDRPHVIGYSFGGMVAQEMAIRFPDLVNHLVLASSTAGGAGGASFPVHKLLDLSPWDRAHRGLEIADTRFDEAFQAKNPDTARTMIEARMAGQTRFTQEPRARLGLRNQLEARAAHNSFDRLKVIHATTLVLAGENDGQAPAAHQQAMAKEIPSAIFKTLPGAHDFIFENALGYQVIRDFLTGELCA